MKTPVINRDEVREHTGTIPMTTDEKEAIKKLSKTFGISMSAFVRMAVREYIRKADM